MLPWDRQHSSITGHQQTDMYQACYNCSMRPRFILIGASLTLTTSTRKPRGLIFPMPSGGYAATCPGRNQAVERDGTRQIQSSLARDANRHRGSRASTTTRYISTRRPCRSRAPTACWMGIRTPETTGWWNRRCRRISCELGRHCRDGRYPKMVEREDMRQDMATTALTSGPEARTDARDERTSKGRVQPCEVSIGEHRTSG